ncbi:hypothetical protein KA107_03795 [Candidatus Pacearchaeota archaeon]|nr:hypothetical protein [Candidatus Pacearchaeota archaeon]
MELGCLFMKEYSDTMKLFDSSFLKRSAEECRKNLLDSRETITNLAPEVVKENYIFACAKLGLFQIAYETSLTLGDPTEKMQELQGMLAYQLGNRFATLAYLADIRLITAHAKQAFSSALYSLLDQNPDRHAAILADSLGNDFASNIMLGDIFLRAGRYPEAMQAYNRSRKVRERTPDAPPVMPRLKIANEVLKHSSKYKDLTEKFKSHPEELELAKALLDPETSQDIFIERTNLAEEVKLLA